MSAKRFQDIIPKDRLHHAYCVAGQCDTAVPALLEWCETELGVATKGNPDFWSEHMPSFGIDESRALRERQGNAAVGGGRKVFVISFVTITREAENALLKILEEPTAGTHFFFVTPSAHTLLPTLKSRVHIVTWEGAPAASLTAVKFLAMTPAERLKASEQLIEDKDKAAIGTLLDGVERQLHAMLASNAAPPGSSAGAHALDDLMRLRTYLYDRSSSVKMILEFIAASLPVIKK